MTIIFTGENKVARCKIGKELLGYRIQVIDAKGKEDSILRYIDVPVHWLSSSEIDKIDRICNKDIEFIELNGEYVSNDEDNNIAEVIDTDEHTFRVHIDNLMNKIIEIVEIDVIREGLRVIERYKGVNKKLYSKSDIKKKGYRIIYDDSTKVVVLKCKRIRRVNGGNIDYIDKFHKSIMTRGEYMSMHGHN